MNAEELAERFGDRYNAELARAILDSARSGKQTGVPGYLGLRSVAIGPGFVEYELDVTAEVLNPAGVAHGAVVASLVDHTLGTAVMPLMPPNHWPATLEYKINYLAPAREGLLSARGEVRSISSRTAVVQVECTSAGRTVAVALGTIAITPPKAPPP